MLLCQKSAQLKSFVELESKLDCSTTLKQKVSFRNRQGKSVSKNIKTVTRDVSTTLRDSSSSLLRLVLLAASHSSITRGSRNSTDQEGKGRWKDKQSKETFWSHKHSRGRELWGGAVAADISYHTITTTYHFIEIHTKYERGKMLALRI